MKENAMNNITENDSRARRRSERQLFQPDIEYNALADKIIDDEKKHNSQRTGRSGWMFLAVLKTAFLFVTMHRSTKTGLIGIAVLICVITVILLLNLVSIQPKLEEDCINWNGTETCHSTDLEPYRYYGTKTTYEMAVRKKTDNSLQTGECIPKVFYLLSRHATRYPDKEDIVEMIERLPILRGNIFNSSLYGKANMCNEDIEKLKGWTETLEPENDNKLSASGEQEAVGLAQRLKDRFPSILRQKYTPSKFLFEYTSRERTRSTGEFFAKGLFGRDADSVDFNGHANDKVLQFHKECKILQKGCKSDALDLYELKKFEKGPVMKKLIESVSERVGFEVSMEDVEVMYKSCVFGYALKSNDIWCSVFSSNELKVLEYHADIDDYYKDAYGNEINYEQACPVANFLVNLFKSASNTSEGKAVFHFSHAGAVKKVYPMFGLFHDSTPLMADGLCSQEDRKWKSSLIVPFNSNIVFILYQCSDAEKIAAYQNEKAVILGGCSTELCPSEDFYEKYKPIAENCNIKELCCSCCRD